MNMNQESAIKAKKFTRVYYTRGSETFVHKLNETSNYHRNLNSTNVLLRLIKATIAKWIQHSGYKRAEVERRYTQR